MKNKDIVVILDNIRSRENVGSIFRTADAAGVSKIYLCGITPTPSAEKQSLLSEYDRIKIATDKIAKTALGAEKWVPWEYYKQTWQLMEKLKKDGYQVLALEKVNRPFDGFRASKDIFKFRVKDGPLVLVVGNEVSGLSPRVLRRSSEVVSIPMYGRKESLNVAVAFGIAVYALIGA